MTDGRLLKVVMLEAMEVGCKGRWVKELQQSLVRFKWKGLDAEAMSGLTLKEVKQVLKDIAWREVREVWREAARERPKLEVIGSLMDAECKARCVEIECKMQRRMMVKLRGGTAELRVETGRWCGLSRGERLCKNCDSGEVEDVKHFVCRCVFVAEERREMARLMNEIVVEWESMKDDERVMGTGGGMQRWKSAEGAAEDVAEKDKLPLKNYAHCDSFDTVTFNYITVLHGADTLVFVLYNTVHLNNKKIYTYIFPPTNNLLTYIQIHMTVPGYNCFQKHAQLPHASQTLYIAL